MFRPKKYHPLLSSASLAWISLAALADGAVYSTNFDSFSDGNIAGQDGWAVNATTLDSFKPGEIIPSFGYSPWGSKSATIGYSTGLSVPKVFVSRTYPSGGTTPLLPSGGGPNTTFRTDLYLVDSNSTVSTPSVPTDAVRDTFGFRLEDSSHNNLFSFILTPDSQVEFPESDKVFHYASWSTGTNAPVNIYPVPPQKATEEGYFYDLVVTFSAASSGNDVAFAATFGGQSFNGIIPDAATSSGIATVGAFWEPSDATNPGSNYMLFDNLSLVPEPSAALLGLLGASCVLVRRRRD